jgi:hypothetical protein
MGVPSTPGFTSPEKFRIGTGAAVARQEAMPPDSRKWVIFILRIPNKRIRIGMATRNLKMTRKCRRIP